MADSKTKGLYVAGHVCSVIRGLSIPALYLLTALGIEMSATFGLGLSDVGKLYLQTEAYNKDEFLDLIV